MTPRSLVRLRKLCLALPEAHEKLAWGEATFRIRDRMFASYASAENHHGGGRPAAWIKSTAQNQELMVRAAPKRLFVPPYVGPSGWVGMWLDETADWSELAQLLEDGYRLVAPKRLLARIDAE